MQQGSWKKVVSSQTVNATASVNSDPIDVSKLRAISYYVDLESGASCSLGLVYQIINSGQGDANNVGVWPEAEAAKSWITPATSGTLVTSGGITADYAEGFAPMATTWLRLRFTGSGTNGADTVISVYVYVVEETSAIR